MSRITYQFRVFLAYATIVFIVLAYTGFVSIQAFSGGVTTLLTRLGMQQSRQYVRLISEMRERGMPPDEIKALLVGTGDGAIDFLDAPPKGVDWIAQKPATGLRQTATEYQYYIHIPELDAYLKLTYEPGLETLMGEARRTFVWEFFMIFLVTVTIGVYLTRFTLRQVRVLRQALQRIGQGDFTQRIRFHSHDEFGELARVIDQTAEQLQQIQRERHAILNRVSHELKTPVSIAVNLLYVASKLSDQEEVKEKIETARKQLLFQARLVDDILYAPYLQESLSLDLELIDIKTMLERAALPYEIYLDSLGIQLTLSISPECESKLLEADAKRLGQVFANIIYNAARHLAGQPDPTLVITLTCDRQTVHIHITDNGPGIPPEILPHIFEPYVSAAEVAGKGMGGRGLGLAIAREIVEAHGGDISVESPVAAGRGARLIVRLPLFDEERLFQ